MPDLEPPLPFGTPDLDPSVKWANERVTCYVRGCRQQLRPPTRTFAGDVCPTHGIRCHGAKTHTPTYSYRDVRRNVIIDPELLATRVVGHPFKFESHRLGLENSEDALTWNVFRSLQRANLLKHVGELVTGIRTDAEPDLYLWGLKLTDDAVAPWDLLVAARERFESNLPVDRPLTEPDIALHLPGRYLVLIEAKFTSPNPSYAAGPRKDARSLTKDELLRIYHDPGLAILDRPRAVEAYRVHYQLWRNTVFAEWMAKLDDRRTQAFHANLTRTGEEIVSCAEFRSLLNPDATDRFVHIAWEDLHRLTSRGLHDPVAARLDRYLRTKTTRLRPAFRVG